MGALYNVGIWFYERSIGLAAGCGHHKAKQWCQGRRDIFNTLASALTEHSVHRRLWIHAASLGEFEQGRPLIEYIKAHNPATEIILTFFSPSGYEIRKSYPLADHVFYLPSDRPHNVRRFLDIVKPDAAIFIKYEFWLNYLAELRKREIATYLISATFRRNSIFFKPWGGAWREALRGFNTMFLQDDNSARLLTSIGITNTEVTGDTRCDRVADIAQSRNHYPTIELFKGDNPLFVAGSTWPKDEELILELCKRHPDIKFIVAPHEIHPSNIRRLAQLLQGRAVCYSEAEQCSDLASRQVMILDTMGMLSSVYGYARWAYIGGGFGAGIHNTLEAAVYGLPLAFGPRHTKFHEACDLIACGAAESVRSKEELTHWFAEVKNGDNLHHAAEAARHYVERSRGATEHIYKNIITRL